MPHDSSITRLSNYQMNLSDLPTPQVLIDHARAMRNIDRAQQLADAAGVRLRPHAKTHKSPIVASWQIERGAIGVCCAKLGEAEVFVDAGVGNVRLPYPVHPSNAPRLMALMDRATMSIIVDHLDVACGWSEAMRRAGRTLDVLVKVDVGFHRCGIDPDGEPLAFLQAVARLPGVRLRGLLSHAGHALSRGVGGRPGRDRAAGSRHAVAAARAGRGIRHRARRTLRRGDADPALQRRRAGHHRAAAGQLRLLRSHAGRTWRRVARRLRADRPGDGRVEAGGRPDHPGLRQQDAHQRSGARSHQAPRATAPCWPAWAMLPARWTRR